MGVNGCQSLCQLCDRQTGDLFRVYTVSHPMKAEIGFSTTDPGEDKWLGLHTYANVFEPLQIWPWCRVWNEDRLIAPMNRCQ